MCFVLFFVVFCLFWDGLFFFGLLAPKIFLMIVSSMSKQCGSQCEFYGELFLISASF